MAHSVKIDIPFRVSDRIIIDAVRITDIVIILVALYALDYLSEYNIENDKILASKMWFVLTFLFVSKMSVIYKIKAIMNVSSVIDQIIGVIFTSCAFVMSMQVGFGGADEYSFEWIRNVFLLSVSTVLLGRLCAFVVLQRLWSQGAIGQLVVILGCGQQSEKFIGAVRANPPYLKKFTGVFALGKPAPTESVAGLPVLGALDDLLLQARRGEIDEVVVALPWSDNARVTEAVEVLKQLPISVHLSSDLVGFDLKFRPVVGGASELTLFEVVRRPISGWGLALKTAFDFSAALVALILLAPLFALLAILIKCDSPGPVLFVQERLGYNNAPFRIYKFRSMRHGAEPDGVTRQAQRGDPRVTRVGRFIRATSLDELPQLFNVLNGTMSLVGPRPHALSHNDEYGRFIRSYFARHKVKPGITGWAQVHGLRGETADIDEMIKRVEHDVYYAENWSLALDIRIIVQTFFVFLFQRKAY